MTETPPDTAIIVPYRDRASQLEAFQILIPHMLDSSIRTYEIFFIHQKDTRNFNRGAMKNIGFIYIKQKYPKTYSNITLVFHDIDTIPSRRDMFDYTTVPHTIKHFYGYKYALGGIFAIKASDFEKINGFPNFWAWGFEDNLLKDRWARIKGNIDYSEFRDVFHKDVLCLFHGFDRLRHRNDLKKYEKLRISNNNLSGITTLTNIKYQQEKLDSGMNMVHVTNFTTTAPEEREKINKDDMISVMKSEAHRRRHRKGKQLFKMW